MVIWPNLTQEAIDVIDEFDGIAFFMWPCLPDQYAEEDRPNHPVPDWPDENVRFDEKTKAFWMPMMFRNEPY